MSGEVRGRVLIINSLHNMGMQRTGSEVDYRNISTLFKKLKFDIVKSEAELTDLTAQVLFFILYNAFTELLKLFCLYTCTCWITET